MDELDMIERFIALGREISEIRAANRVYWTRTLHNSLEEQLHQRRLERLKDIKKYLFLWFGTRLPKTDIHFLNKRETGRRTSQPCQT